MTTRLFNGPICFVRNWFIDVDDGTQTRWGGEPPGVVDANKRVVSRIDHSLIEGPISDRRPTNPHFRGKPKHERSRMDTSRLNTYQASLVEGANKLARVAFGRSTKEGRERYDRSFWSIVALGRSNVRLLELIPGKKPSDAIKAIFEHPDRWSFDCGEFVQAIQLYSFLHLLGEKAFDELPTTSGDGSFYFKQHFSTGLRPKVGWEEDHGSVQRVNLAHGLSFPESIALEDLFKRAPVGSEITFTNPDAPEDSAFRSENTIKVGPDLFIALQIKIHDPFVSRGEIEVALAKDALRGRPGPYDIPSYVRKYIRIKAVLQFAFP